MLIINQSINWMSSRPMMHEYWPVIAEAFRRIHLFDISWTLENSSLSKIVLQNTQHGSFPTCTMCSDTFFRCYIFVSFRNNVVIIAHYDDTPFWISVGINKDEVESGIRGHSRSSLLTYLLTDGYERNRKLPERLSRTVRAGGHYWLCIFGFTVVLLV